jgi:signal transduction histidine kinase
MFPAAPHGWLDKLTSILVCLMLLLNLIFNRVVLGLFSPPRRAMLGLTALILLIPIELAAMASGYVRLSLQINALLALFSMPLFLVLSFFTQREAVPGRRILRIIFSVQTVFMLISLAPFLLGLETTEWRMQAMRMAFGFVYSILMFLLLYLRSQQLKREGAQAVMKLELTKRQLQTEQKQRDEQNRFMSMLNHELKTPLSVIRMALSLENMTAPVKSHAQQATNDIGAVIERCLQTDQLEQRKLPPKRQATRLDVMLSELQATAPHRILLQCSELPVIATDPQLLRIALNNLTDNALKYAKSQSIVQMDAAISEQHGRQGILVGIANIPGAAGMPDPACVFNKYYRSPDAHGQTGSGLGLYVVCNVITLLAGWVRYCPSENDVRFELWLPL